MLNAISMFQPHFYSLLRQPDGTMRCVWLALLTLATSRGIQLAPVEQKTDRRLLPRLPRLPPLPQLPLQELQERVQKLQERVRKVLEAQLTVTKP